MKEKRQKRYVKKIKTVCLAGLLVTAQCAGMVLPVEASPAEVTGQEIGLQTEIPVTASQVDETNLIPSHVRDIFDAQFYRNTYPDVDAAFGDDEQALFKHFMMFGLKEGRIGSPILNIAMYRSLYPDLAAAFGDNWDLYVLHYFRFGIAEGRSNGIAKRSSNAVTAKTSDTGAVYVNNKGTSYDDKGNVLIPWDVITRENYLTLETLRQRCGDTLVLLLDKNGNVTFVGGNFSDVKVKDIDSARESLHCMMKLLNFPEDTTQLYLTHVNTDSRGDIYYRFSAQEKETGYLYADTDIIVGADQSGKVLSLSSSSGTRYYNTELLEKTVDWDEITARKAAEGWTLCPGEPVLKYDSVLNQFVWVKYYEKDDIVCEYRVAVSTDSSYDIDEECYYQGMPTAGSYSYDFYFKNDISTVEWTVYDYYGNEVKLPMAYEQGKGYYLLDKKRKIVGIDYSDSLVPRYFQNQGELATYYISAVSNIQSVWDTYYELGLFDDEAPTPILFRQNALEFYQASCGYDCGVLSVEIYSEDSVATYDTIAHELAHGVLAMITGNLAYRNATGAINESYADILGNLLEMIAVENGSKLGYAGADNWLYAEGVTGVALRDMAVPGNAGQPDRVGGEYFEMDTNDRYAALNDYGGVHENSGILNRICYRMYAEAGISKKELFLLWYDTLQQLNEDTDYGSIRRYMEYALRRHGLENKIDTVNKVFDDGRVDSYVSGTTWKEMEAAPGSSKVTLNFKNMPENIVLSVLGYDQERGAKLYIDNDSAGTPGVLLKEGSSLDHILVVPYQNNVPAFSSVFGTVRDPVVGTEDRNLEIDYRDVLAAELTKNNVALSEQDQNSFLEVMFVLSDTLTGSVNEWKIILKRPDEDVDVTFDINVTLLQAVQSEPSGNMSSIDLPRRAVLCKDSEYAYTITLKKSDGTEWEKEANLNTGDMQTEESRTVRISFEETADDWIKHTVTETAALSVERGALTEAGDVAAGNDVEACSKVAQNSDMNRADDVVIDDDTAENTTAIASDSVENDDILAGDYTEENEAVIVDDAGENDDTLEGDDIAENATAIVGDAAENNDVLSDGDIAQNVTAIVGDTGEKDDLAQEKSENMEADKNAADVRTSDEIEHETVMSEEGEEETGKNECEDDDIASDIGEEAVQNAGNSASGSEDSRIDTTATLW